MVNERVFLFGGPSQPFVAGVMEAQPLDPGLTPLLLGEGQTEPGGRGRVGRAGPTGEQGAPCYFLIFSDCHQKGFEKASGKMWHRLQNRDYITPKSTTGKATKNNNKLQL